MHFVSSVSHKNLSCALRVCGPFSLVVHWKSSELAQSIAAGPHQLLIDMHMLFNFNEVALRTMMMH